MVDEQQVTSHYKLSALEAERGVLGAILLDSDSFYAVDDLLSPEDFYYIHHIQLFRIFREFAEQGKEIDVVPVKQRLRELGEDALLDQVDLAALVAGAVHITRESLLTQAQIISRLSLRRKMHVEAQAIQQDALNGELDSGQVLARAEQRLQALRAKLEQRNGTGAVPMSVAVGELYDYLSDPEPDHGIKTGLDDLDALVGGLRAGELTLIAARPSMGKTSFMLTLALNAARAGKRVLILSLEMSRLQLATRLLAMSTGVDAKRIREGDKEQLDQVLPKVNGLGDLPIFIDQTTLGTITHLCSEARRLKQQGLDLICIDYLQLMDVELGAFSKNFDTRNLELAYISRTLKRLSIELEVPVVALSQLSRQTETRSDKRPVLADLRDSGALEQDADRVLTLYRDDYYDPNTETPNVVEVVVLKARNGPTGRVLAYFDKETGLFRNLAKQSL